MKKMRNKTLLNIFNLNQNIAGRQYLINLHNKINEDVSFRDLALRDCSLSNLNLDFISMFNIDFREARMISTKFYKLDKCILDDAGAIASSFYEVTRSAFKGCLLSEASFHKRLSECDFDSASMRGVILDGVNANGDGVIGNCFRRADLTSSTAINSHLSHGNFRDACLRGVNFSRASLRFCDFRKADLSSANLISADLFGSIFDNANLHGCLIRQSTIVKELETGKNLQKAVIIKKVLHDTFDDIACLLVDFSSFELVFSIRNSIGIAAKRVRIVKEADFGEISIQISRIADETFGTFVQAKEGGIISVLEQLSIDYAGWFVDVTSLKFVSDVSAPCESAIAKLRTTIPTLLR